MDILTVGEIAYRLSEPNAVVSSDAARKRLKRHGFEPVRQIGANGMYALSEKDIAFLKSCNVRGKPPASKAEDASKPKAKRKITTKKK